ncbi:MAG: branched-chain amino acid ABC transporter permease [Thermodesulfobacteriota bacterium]
MSYEFLKKFLWFPILLFLVLLPYLGVNIYNLHVYTLICIYIIITIGLNVIFGHTGQISLGHAAFYAIGAYTSALLTTRLGFPFVLAFFCAGIVSLIIGLGIGAATLKLEGAYLAMATIGFGEIVRMVLIHWEKVSGGPAGISKIPDPSILGWQLHSPQSKYYLVLFVTIVAFIAYRNLMASNYGKKFNAVKENVLAAQAMGVDTTRTKVIAFGISTLYAGLGGSLYAHLNCYIAPDAFPISESITLLLIVVLGGMGNILGPILGSIILIEVKESLRMLKDYNMLIYGFTLMALMIFAPKGFSGINIHRLFHRYVGGKI